MTTLLEFLHPIKGAGRQSNVLAVLYFFKHYDDRDAASVGQIRAALQQARVPRARTMNVSDVLLKAAPYADRVPGERGTWTLTTTGEKYVREEMDLPARDIELHHETGGLERLAANVHDEGVRSYIDEAIRCLSVDALRAAVVFLWTGAAWTLQSEALAKGAKPLNTALQKHDPKARNVTKLEDFAYIKDKTLLLACGDLGLLDKGQRATLEEALNLRNRCGHPTRYRIGSAKVASFIEDVVGIVWSGV